MVDTCGTGDVVILTVSTNVAYYVSLGVTIAKHGNKRLVEKWALQMFCLILG